MKPYESCGIRDIFTMKHTTVFQLMSEMDGTEQKLKEMM
jgi:hypothetical protein